MAKKTENTTSSKPKAKAKPAKSKAAKSSTKPKADKSSKSAKSEKSKPSKSTKTASKPKPAIKKKTVAPKVSVRRNDANLQVTDHDIARRAYELFLSRGCAHGRDLDDWLQAEAELRG